MRYTVYVQPVRKIQHFMGFGFATFHIHETLSCSCVTVCTNYRPTFSKPFSIHIILLLTLLPISSLHIHFPALCCFLSQSDCCFFNLAVTVVLCSAEEGSDTRGLKKKRKVIVQKRLNQLFNHMIIDYFGLWFASKKLYLHIFKIQSLFTTSINLPPKRFFSAIYNLNRILFLLQIKRRCTFLCDTINILTHWLY